MKTFSIEQELRKFLTRVFSFSSLWHWHSLETEEESGGGLRQRDIIEGAIGKIVEIDESRPMRDSWKVRFPATQTAEYVDCEWWCKLDVLAAQLDELSQKQEPRPEPELQAEPELGPEPQSIVSQQPDLSDSGWIPCDMDAAAFVGYRNCRVKLIVEI